MGEDEDWARYNGEGKWDQPPTEEDEQVQLDPAKQVQFSKSAELYQAMGGTAAYDQVWAVWRETRNLLDILPNWGIYPQVEDDLT